MTSIRDTMSLKLKLMFSTPLTNREKKYDPEFNKSIKSRLVDML